MRVFLARALVREPRLLLLDEPTTGVDIKTRHDVLHLLAELNHEGVTVVLTTHETEEARMNAAVERIAALDAVVEPPRLIRIEQF